MARENTSLILFLQPYGCLHYFVWCEIPTSNAFLINANDITTAGSPFYQLGDNGTLPLLLLLNGC